MDSKGTASDQAEAPNRQSQQPESRDLAVPAGMVSGEFEAMGTTIKVLVPDLQAEAALQSVQDLFSTWQETLTRFNPESELSRLNARAGTPVQVSPLLFRAVNTAVIAARATEGLYFSTLQQQMVRLGYDRTFSEVAEGVPPEELAPTPGGGWRQIVADATTSP